MKKFLVTVAVVMFVCFVAVNIVQAAPGDITPVQVKLTTNNDKVLSTCKGLKVRINNNKSDFFAFNYFISFEDLKALATKRKVMCTYNAKSKKLEFGTKVFAITGVNPKGNGNVPFDTVKMVNYNKKNYFDLWDCYAAMNFASVSKSTDGYYLYVAEPKK